MAVTVTYNGSTIHTSERTETFTLLTNNLVMKSDIVVYVDDESSVSITYNGEQLELDTSAGEHTYNLLCEGKLMLSNLTFSVVIGGSINYNRVLKCTTNSTITLPSSDIMIVVIGGGSGGQGGYSGKSGNKPTTSQGSPYTVYSMVLADSQKDYGIADGAHMYTINPSLYYRYAYLDQATGTLTFQYPLDSKIDNKTVSGSTFKKYVETDGYAYFKSSSTTYYHMDVRKVNSVDHIFGTKYKIGTSTEYRNGTSQYSSRTAGGTGGQGGAGGSGGKVFKKELSVTPGSSADVSIGSGGALGGSGGQYGLSGSATTITIDETVYSSDNGVLMPDGFVNTVGVDEEEVYAAQGIDGVEGGSGGGYTLYYNSEVGNSVAENSGGAVGENRASGSKYIGGGSGGGAAYGANGGDGGKAYASKTGKGGDGANGNNANPALLSGCGGNGGNGGGGGGNAGGSQVSGVSVASAGKGGTGGTGSNGANGIVLIYYNENEE